MDNLSLSVGEGEIIAVVGESGSGKSSVGLAIPGLITASIATISGSIWFKGEEISRLPSHDLRKFRGKEISMIFQNARAALNPVRTVGDQLLETLQTRDKDLSASRARARALELFELVGISDPITRLGAYPHQLSGGMCQRVMIALAVSLDPSLLIADEPTSALDVTVKVQILQLLKRLTAQIGTSIIIITHDLNVARALADRVAVMYAGQIVELGPAVDVLKTPKMPYTQALFQSLPRLGGERGEQLAAIPGQPPNLTAPPQGCRFADRCPHAANICQSAPELFGITDSRKARCFFPHDSLLRAQTSFNQPEEPKAAIS
ncbi:ABC transporter ATP-binding protein [Arthrobacter sp. B1805]|uniref:ABC transporter ATP-binding protein n=1 Tax=Arthrobacter sp. B1805 TaxID=2058892 RepID=UPI001C683BC9|nr:ABC transporter ATP-binding protein [Arthrobacter sp. B1805]